MSMYYENQDIKEIEHIFFNITKNKALNGFYPVSMHFPKQGIDYSDLSIIEKRLFDDIESIFINKEFVTRKQFVRVLFMLGNKYKYSKQLKKEGL